MHAGAILMNYNIYLPLLVSVNTMRFRGCRNMGAA